MALPTVLPPPVTTCRYSAGSPHSSISICASAMLLNGVWLAGFSTTGQPAAMAGPTLWTTRLSGKLNGAIAPTTPMGMRSVNPNLPSPAEMASSGIISPPSLRASAAANWKVPAARSASTRAVLIGLAASLAMICANSSRRAVSRAAARSRISARFHNGRGFVWSAALAIATARSTSAAVCAGISPMTESS